MSDNTVTKPREVVPGRAGNYYKPDNGTNAIYCRAASGAFQDAGEIEIQEEKVRFFAEEHGYGDCAVYRDNGESGNTLDRPGMMALLDNIRAGDVKRVIVRDITRLARDYILLQKLIDLFVEYGVELVSVGDSGVISLV